MRVELSHGQWAEMREADEITEAGQRSIMRASLQMPAERRKQFRAAAGDEEKSAALNDTLELEDLDAFKAMSDATILAYLRSWSFEEKPTVEALQDLSLKDYEALEAATKAIEARPDFTPSPDPASPTNPSSA